MSTKYVQAQPFTLAGAGNAIGDTTLVLTDLTQINGTLLTMADFGTIGYGTIEPNSSSGEEQISFSGITQNANGTATLTGVKTVLTVSPYTETAGLAKQHAGGVILVISNTAGFYNKLTGKENAEVISGAWQFPNNASTPILGTSYVAPTIAWQVASKGYVDSVAVAGAPNADTTTKGIVEIATGAELAAGTNIGGTGATVVASGGSFTSTSAGAGDVNKVPVLNGSGQIAQGFIALASTTVAGQSELATGAETFAGTATGGTGATLVPPNSSFIGTSSGAADSNKVPVLGSVGSLAPGFTYQTGIAGETVTAGTALYLKASDSRLYLAQGTADEKTFSFAGVAVDAGNAGSTIRFASPGQILTTPQVLTPGAYYYVTDVAGILGTAAGTRFAKVGQAHTTSTMRIIEPKFFARGNVTITSATTFTVTTGFYPALIRLVVGPTAAATAGGSIGDDSNSCIAFRMVNGAGTPADAIANGTAWYCYDRNAAAVRSAGTVSAKTSTSFTLNCSTYTNDVSVMYIAESF